MSLQIIGAGFARTGTLSTCTALNKLGFPCYHMTEAVDNNENKSHLDFWNDVANAPQGAQHNWQQVFEKYTATVDNPGCSVWKELLAAYPQAKVLITLHPRGPEAWYESTMDTIYFTESKWQFKVLKLVVPFARKMGNMTSKLIWQRLLKGTMPNRAAAITRYQEHIEEVKDAVPEDRLLIFSVDQGWEPLCTFLGVGEPDVAFPNVNERAAIKKDIAKITNGAYVVLAVLGFILIASVLGIGRLLG